MGAIYAGAIVGFILGLVGFIITRFWILPIWRYRKIKTAAVADIDTYCCLLADAATQENLKELLKAKRKSLRRQATDLASTYNEILPYWYKLLLESRPESPVEASAHLMTLCNIHQHDHALNRAQKIKHHLRIK